MFSGRLNIVKNDNITQSIFDAELYSNKIPPGFVCLCACYGGAPVT